MPALRGIGARPWPADKAFSFIAEVRNFERWDPGGYSVAMVHLDDPGLGSAYDVEVRTGRFPLVLRNQVVEWDASHRMRLVAQTRTLHSVDEIRVEQSGAGSLVTYDARLKTRGMLRVANPPLAIAFRRVGNPAAAGLRHALDEKPEGPS